MLIPIVNYANSDYNAVVSLFGEKTTEDTYDIVYHPAFENTLLGIRLLQADIIFFDLGETWQLPKLEGQTILGAGETLGAGEGRSKILSALSGMQSPSGHRGGSTRRKFEIRRCGQTPRDLGSATISIMGDDGPRNARDCRAARRPPSTERLSLLFLLEI
jgi:hypothetical protein